MSVVLIRNETPDGSLFRDYSKVIEFDFGSALKRMSDDEFLKFCKITHIPPNYFVPISINEINRHV